MKRLASLLVCFVFAAPALADINFTYAPGATIYVRVRTSDTASVAVALTEGTSNAIGFYRVTDAALVASGLNTAGTYPFKIFVGSPDQSANHPWIGYGVFRTNGATELPPEVDISHVLSDPVCD